jgi:hypothetical protein
MKKLEILEQIVKDLKEKFDNDPSIMRVATVILNEFKIRSKFIKKIKEDENSLNKTT